MIPGDLLSAFPHRQFHTLPGLLDSRAALPNSYPNALRAKQGGSTIFMMVFGMTWPGGELMTTRARGSARPDVSTEQSQGLQTVSCLIGCLPEMKAETNRR